VTAREFGINTYSYIWSMRAADCVRHLAATGCRQFELMIHPPHLPLDGFDSAARRELRLLLRDAGATVTALNMPSLDHNLASPLARIRDVSIGMFNDAIDLAADIGAERLIVVPGRMNPLFPPPVTERVQWITDSVATLLPRADARGVGLAIENIPFAPFPDAKSLGDFVRGFNSPAIGVCYDVANAHFIGESPAEGIAALADRLRIVHFSDTDRTAWRHDRIGLGSVPFAAAARALNVIAFDGACTLEIIDTDPDRALRDSIDRLAKLGFAPDQ
jgi:L-ribulose-5-phosphate 3-epimerase